MLSASFVSLLSTYQNLTGNTTQTFFGLANAPIHQIVDEFDSVRVTGPLDDPNFYAQTLLMVLPLTIYRAVTAHFYRFAGHCRLGGLGAALESI
jgi:hypothetical protein